MSISLKNIKTFPQGGLDYTLNYDNNTQNTNDLKLLGGIFRDTNYIWRAKGPGLEVRSSKTGTKVGAWVFGGILKDSNSNIVAVEEIPNSNGRISLLGVGVNCAVSGGIICIFDVFNSKVIRAIQIKEKICSLHIVDSGIENLNLPGPLRNFDGIMAIGLEGGSVILMDICRQICEESSHISSKRDELNPSQITILTPKNISKIEQYIEKSVRDGYHVGVHLNVVLDNKTEHFVLKGPKDEDRIHVNKEEVEVCSIYYCPQLTSILVGYNFGAFQLWDLTTLKLVYTSPVCDEHIPVTKFAVLEPTDDPRAFCYIWVSYSNTEFFHSGFPFAVMYAFCYGSKEYHEGYGYLYQDFQYCNIRFQVELQFIEESKNGIQPKGGLCLDMQPITKHFTTKESPSTTGDTLALCVITWSVWFSKTDTQSFVMIFDLNQWYKEQMPSFSNWSYCNNYILRTNLSNLLHLNGHKSSKILNILIDAQSLTQFIGVQKLEEHFLPTSLSFNFWTLRENDVILFYSQGLQRFLISQMESAGPLCLLRPTDTWKQAIDIGLIPLFTDINPNSSLTIETQREILLNIGLEQQLKGWLCKCAAEWANGSFSSAGCSLDFLLTWALERAAVLKANCDKFCKSFFDYSEAKLDENTTILLNSCIRQIDTLNFLFKYIVEKLESSITCIDSVKEYGTELEMLSIYFEVLQWLVNVGLLPECHPSAYPRRDSLDRISAPYPAQQLIGFYNERRTELRLLNKDFFQSNDSLLFIDNLISRKCGGNRLQTQWEEDGGNGFYPPPSLQSLIRTYLVEGAGISHKHSLVIYLFLDLAMALDQSRYSSVVTHLIKFPAVFKVSPSIIKITQAFWQLDHGDFTTAIEQLVDPFVLGDDLQPWHHTIAMRSLLIHKQSNFALLYMQIRKPPICDENDVLTALSLLVANNMLDEAFYFKKQYQSNNGDKLLTHLFQECSRNQALHTILYKYLNTEEEKTFFKYLKSVENPSNDDLQIFYYLLRSRFIESFETYKNRRRNLPEKFGLAGQGMATKTDQIIKIFQTLLPDVNKNLVNYIRKEKNNLWKEADIKSTPMSVFVHNKQECLQYKSNIIHAALVKAKHTFQNVITESYNKELVTEDTPFLKTPTFNENGTRLPVPIITPEIINEEDGPPAKKVKLSPRLSTKTPQSPVKSLTHSLTLTPIVKRKRSLQQELADKSPSLITICTPQSILKVRHLVEDRRSICDQQNQSQYEPDLSLQNISPRLQSRPSLTRTPKSQHVHFDKTTRFPSFGSSDQSGTPNIISISSSSRDHSSVLSNTVSEEAFYSPDQSADNVENEKENNESKTNICDIEAVANPPDSKETLNEQPNETDVASDVIDQNDKEDILINSPRGRKSYKRTYRETSPTRSSPRLSKLFSGTIEKQNESISSESTISDRQVSTKDSMSTDSLSPEPKILPKVKGRKSLSRQVLEQNTFGKIVNKEILYTQSESRTLREESPQSSKVTVLETSLKMVDKFSSNPDTPETTKIHSVNSSVNKTQILESTLDSDLTIATNFESDQDSSLSDSLRDYYELMYNVKTNQKDIEQQEVQEKEELVQNEVYIDKNLESNHEEKSEDLDDQEPMIIEDNEEYPCKQDESGRQPVFATLESVQTEQDANIIESVYNFDTDSTDSENSELHEFEKAFIDKSLEKSTLSKQSDVILITSSSEDDDTSSSSNSEDTNKTENSVDLNICYEDNFYEQSQGSNESVKIIEETLKQISPPDENEAAVKQILFIEDQDKTNQLVNVEKDSGISEQYRTNVCAKENCIIQENILLIQSNNEEGNLPRPHGILDEQIQPTDFKVPINQTVEAQESSTKSDHNKKSSREDNENQLSGTDIDVTVGENTALADNVIETEIPKKNKLFVTEEMNNAKKELATNLKHPEDVSISIQEKASGADIQIKQIEIKKTEQATNVTIGELGEIREKSSESCIQKEITNSGEIANKNKEQITNVTIEEDREIREKSSESCIQKELNVSEVKNSKETLATKKGKGNAVEEEEEFTEKSNEKTQINFKTSIEIPVNETMKNIAERTEGTVQKELEVTLLDVVRTSERRVYSTRTKKNASNQINSSSDMTDDERLRKEISTGQKESPHIEETVQKNLKETITLDKGQRKEISTGQKESPHIEETVQKNLKETITLDKGQKAEKKVYSKTKKKTLKDQETTSFSDRNQSEVFSKCIVISLDHTPEMEEKITKSAGIDGIGIDVKSDTTKDIDLPLTKSENVRIGRRTRRILSETDIAYIKPTQQLISENKKIDCDNDNSQQLIDDTKVLKMSLRRKRSASVDEVRTFSRQKSSKRNESIAEIKEESISRRNKAQSVKQMSVIHEEPSAVEKSESSKTNSKSVAESYTTSRRLTRRQANIVKDISSINESCDSELTVELDQLDPIKLLDKQSFEGQSDPDEKQVYEPSSPSTSTTSTRKNKLRGRSASVKSDISLTPPDSASKKSVRATRSRTKSPVSIGVTTRSRKYSESDSVISEQSTPPKRSRSKKLNESDDDVFNRTTRSRSASVSSVKSVESRSSRKKATGKRLVSTKSDLLEIVEESDDEVTSTSQKRKTRQTKK